MSSLGVAIAWSPRLRAQRGATAPAPNGPGIGDRGSGIRDPKIPPPIAALKSMKDRARPFTKEERLARIEKAKKLMAQEKIDAILLTGGASTMYFANVSLGGGERLWALVIPFRGQPFIVCPAC